MNSKQSRGSKSFFGVRLAFLMISLVSLSAGLAGCSTLASIWPEKQPTTVPPTPSLPTNPLPATWTPTPIGSPTPTPTRYPTWTPQPTSTPAFRIEYATATSFPPVLQVTGQERPELNFDLWFLSKKTLLRYDREQGEVVPVNDPFTQKPIDAAVFYQYRRFAGIAAVVQSIAGSENGTDHSVKIWNHLQQLPLNNQFLGVSQFFSGALSPDGLWFAFAGIPVEPQATSSGEPVFARVWLLPVSVGETPTPRVLADCRSFCGELTWTPDGAAVIWFDDTGFWRGAPSLDALAEPEELIRSSLFLESGWPDFSGLRVDSVSLSGRYLVVYLEGNSSRFVVDLQMGLIAEMPGFYSYYDAGLSYFWTPTDQLLISRSGVRGGVIRLPHIELWSLVSANNRLGFEQAAIQSSGEATRQGTFAPWQVSRNEIYYLLVDYTEREYLSTTGIYRMDLDTGVFAKITDIPYASYTDFLWTPDLAAVLLETQSRSYLVISRAPTIYNFTALLGSSACCYTWVP